MGLLTVETSAICLFLLGDGALGGVWGAGAGALGVVGFVVRAGAIALALWTGDVALTLARGLLGGWGGRGGGGRGLLGELWRILGVEVLGGVWIKVGGELLRVHP